MHKIYKIGENKMKLDARELVQDLPDDVDVQKLLNILANIPENKFESMTTYMLVYKEIIGNTLCKKYCNWLIDNMHHGNEHGRKWTVEQTNKFAYKNSIRFNSKYTEYEFNAAFHLMYYNYHSIFSKSGKSEKNILAKMADCYLTDENASKGKLLNYFFFVAKD